MFSQNSEVAYILYNDQKPSEEFGGRWAGSSGGHTKGKASSLSLCVSETEGLGWKTKLTARNGSPA